MAAELLGNKLDVVAFFLGESDGLVKFCVPFFTRLVPFMVFYLF